MQTNFVIYPQFPSQTTDFILITQSSVLMFFTPSLIKTSKQAVLRQFIVFYDFSRYFNTENKRKFTEIGQQIAENSQKQRQCGKFKGQQVFK